LHEYFGTKFTKYSPVLGRFLSPDMVVQDPANTQGYNRYTYCLNNPLKYTDPSGWYYMGPPEDWDKSSEMIMQRQEAERMRMDMEKYYSGNSFGAQIIASSIVDIRGTIMYVLDDGDPGVYLPGPNGTKGLQIGYTQTPTTLDGYQGQNIYSKEVLNYLDMQSGWFFLRTIGRWNSTISGGYGLNTYSAKLGEVKVKAKRGKAEDDGELLSPVSLKFRVTSPFTESNRVIPELGLNRPHLGIDIGTPIGTPIRNPGRGKVVMAEDTEYGLTVIVKHNYRYNGNKIQTGYTHLSKINVESGSIIERGDIIGYTGKWGTGPHLHFTLRTGGGKVNPTILFPYK
jgi:hypothetical protein